MVISASSTRCDAAAGYQARFGCRDEPRPTRSVTANLYANSDCLEDAGDASGAKREKVREEWQFEKAQRVHRFGVSRANARVVVFSISPGEKDRGVGRLLRATDGVCWCRL